MDQTDETCCEALRQALVAETVGRAGPALGLWFRYDGGREKPVRTGERIVACPYCGKGFDGTTAAETDPRG